MLGPLRAIPVGLVAIMLMGGHGGPSLRGSSQLFGAAGLLDENV